MKRPRARRPISGRHSTVGGASQTVLGWLALCFFSLGALPQTMAGDAYYVSPGGDDRNAGDSDHPWATPSVAISRLNDGDTLFIRHGQYDDANPIDITRSDIAIVGLDRDGNADFADPEDGPLIDGTLPRYRTPAEDLWERYLGDNGEGPIYRTIEPHKSNGGPEDVGGVFHHNGRAYELVRYARGKAERNLLTAEQRVDRDTYWVEGGPVYCGPGVFYDKEGLIDGTPERIYIRLQQTEYMNGLDDLPEDPGRVPIFLKDGSKSRIEINRYGKGAIRNVRIQGLQLRDISATDFGKCSDVVIDRCVFITGSIWLKTPDDENQAPRGFVISNCRLLQSHADYLTWNDIKVPRSNAPARRSEYSAITIDNGWSEVTISDCLIERAWDGITIGGVEGITVSGCTIRDARDDGIQLHSSANRVCIVGNRIVGTAAAISRNGAGDPAEIGSKWIVQNVLHVTGFHQSARRTTDGCFLYERDSPDCCPPECLGLGINAPFGFHLDGKFGDFGDPWLIANNTVLFGPSPVGAGYGLYGVCPRPSPEFGTHRVLNNLFVQTDPTGALDNLGDYTLDGSMTLDGNQYFRNGGESNLWTRIDYPGNSGSPCEDGNKKNCRTFEDFRAHTGWDEHGAYGDPRLNLNDPEHPEDEYAPVADVRCLSCLADLPNVESPCGTDAQYRGARPPLGGGCVVHRGDINCDGLVSFDDIDGFVIALLGRANYCELFPQCLFLNADANCDGAVDFEDIVPLVNCLANENDPACECP